MYTGKGALIWMRDLAALAPDIARLLLARRSTAA